MREAMRLTKRLPSPGEAHPAEVGFDGLVEFLADAGVIDILEAENRRGHVAHAFFKDAMIDRFYAICNCCSCCCGAMQAQRNGTPMLTSSGYVCEQDVEICMKCGDCEPLCQFNAIDLNRDSHIDIDACMGCGVCVNACTHGALSLRPDPSRGEPLEIHKLMQECSADVEKEQSVH